MKIYLILVFLGYMSTVITGYWLKALNLRYLKKYGATVPPEFKGQINEELLRKTRSYRVSIIT